MRGNLFKQPGDANENATDAESDSIHNWMACCIDADRGPGWIQHRKSFGNLAYIYIFRFAVGE
jgi:hypothetical protein